jgi:hypothetical protein
MNVYCVPELVRFNEIGLLYVNNLLQRISTSMCQDKDSAVIGKDKMAVERWRQNFFVTPEQ